MLNKGTKLCILAVSFTFYLVSCHSQRNEGVQFTNILEAKKLLYINKIEEAEIILNDIDTTQLDEHGMASFQTARGFLFHLIGEKLKATEKLGLASLYFDRYGGKHEKAEIFLLYGFLLEKALLNTEASNSYLKALAYYLNEGDSDQYFKALLGVIRTTVNGKEFSQLAEEYLTRNSSNWNQILFLNTISNISVNFRKKLDLRLKSLVFFDDKYDTRKQISLLSNIASNYQTLEMVDSANYYIDKCEKIINEKKIVPIRLFRYYLIKAYINSVNKKYDTALESISIILDHGGDHPGIIANAYYQRTYVYSALGEIKAANEDLHQYVSYLKQEHNDNQKHQIGLLSVQLRLHQQKLVSSKLKIGC